jgi:hypothetical protein
MVVFAKYEGYNLKKKGYVMEKESIIVLSVIGVVIVAAVTFLTVYLWRASKAPATIPVPVLVLQDSLYEAHIQLLGSSGGRNPQKQTYGGSLAAKKALCEQRYPVNSIVKFGDRSFRVDDGKEQEYPSLAVRDCRWVLSLTELEDEGDL